MQRDADLFSQDFELKPAMPKAKTLYEGKGGEYAVMSELLFCGYNVNNMAVDEGIDIVASKDNVFYYIQVKTSALKADYTCSFPIRLNNYYKYIGSNLRYVLVCRCGEDKNTEMQHNVFFVFSGEALEKLVSEKAAKKTGESLVVKIRFDRKSHLPVAYDGDKESDINFYMNRFVL